MHRVTPLVIVISAITVACSPPVEPEPPPAEPSQTADVPLPPVPFEDPGACPFEGCVYREWTAIDEVDALTERSATAPVAFRVGIHDRVTALTGVVITLKPGSVIFRKAVDLSTASGAIHVEPGEVLQLLTYEGEGFFTATMHGDVHRNVDGSTFLDGACDEEPARCIGEIRDKPESVWWVEIRNALGQTAWTNQPEKFAGKDALALAGR